MIVYKPIEVNNTNLISTNLIDAPYNPWYSGGSWALGEYCSVASGGGYSFYRSLQDGNIGNDPLTSPTWWMYESFIYQDYQQAGGYAFGATVQDESSNKVYRSVSENNNNVLDPTATPPWLTVGDNTSTLPAVWSAATTYAVGARVYFEREITSVDGFGNDTEIDIHGVFKSLTNGNINNPPTGIFPSPSLVWELETTYPVPWLYSVYYGTGRVVYDTDGKLWQTPYGSKRITPAASYSSTWVAIGTINKWAAFDQTTSTQAKANNLLTYTVAAPQMDSVILMNVIAETATVTVRDGLGGTILYEETRDLLTTLNSSTITDWWEYFNADFAVFSSYTNVLFQGLPLSATSHITVTLASTDSTSTTDNIFLGDLIISRARELSLTGYGLQSGIRDFSVVTEDGFGGQTFNKRRNRRRMSSREWVTHDQFNRTFRILSDLTATPCVWLAADVDYLSEAMMVKAWYKDFTVEIADVNAIYVNLELEGLL